MYTDIFPRQANQRSQTQRHIRSFFSTLSACHGHPARLSRPSDHTSTYLSVDVRGFAEQRPRSGCCPGLD